MIRVLLAYLLAWLAQRLLQSPVDDSPRPPRAESPPQAAWVPSGGASAPPPDPIAMLRREGQLAKLSRVDFMLAHVLGGARRDEKAIDWRWRQ
jgi:hypothetical protein